MFHTGIVSYSFSDSLKPLQPQNPAYNSGYMTNIYGPESNSIDTGFDQANQNVLPGELAPGFAAMIEAENDKRLAATEAAKVHPDFNRELWQAVVALLPTLEGNKIADLIHRRGFSIEEAMVALRAAGFEAEIFDVPKSKIATERLPVGTKALHVSALAEADIRGLQSNPYGHPSVIWI